MTNNQYIEMIKQGNFLYWNMLGDLPGIENHKENGLQWLTGEYEAAHIKMAGSILNAVFEYDLFSFGHYLQMMQNKNQYFYLAEFDGLPVGVCMSQHGDSFINISWVGTLPGYRKRGIAGYLIQSAERDGINNNKKYSVLHGSPKAAGAYRRAGFKEYYHGKDAFFKGE